MKKDILENLTLTGYSKSKRDTRKQSNLPSVFVQMDGRTENGNFPEVQTRPHTLSEIGISPSIAV